MRKIIVTVSIASLLSLTYVAPVGAFTPALVIPAVIGTLVNLAATVPATYNYATYSFPKAYYAPRVYAAPMRSYAPRVYATPMRSYARRGY